MYYSASKSLILKNLLTIHLLQAWKVASPKLSFFAFLCFLFVYFLLCLRLSFFSSCAQLTLIWHMQVLSRDSVTVSVDAVVYYKIFSPVQSVTVISDYRWLTRAQYRSVCYGYLTAHLCSHHNVSDCQYSLPNPLQWWLERSSVSTLITLISLSSSPSLKAGTNKSDNSWGDFTLEVRIHQWNTSRQLMLESPARSELLTDWAFTLYNFHIKAVFV